MLPTGRVDQQSLGPGRIDGGTGHDLHPQAEGGRVQNLDQSLAWEAPAAGDRRAQVTALHHPAAPVHHVIAQQTGTEGRQVLHQAGLLQHQEAVVVQEDSRPDLTDHLSPLVHAHRPSRPRQEDGGGEASDAAPRDLGMAPPLHHIPSPDEPGPGRAADLMSPVRAGAICLRASSGSLRHPRERREAPRPAAAGRSAS